MKQPKRACPLCGGAVRVTRSVTTCKGAQGSEKFQQLKCLKCGLTGSTSQREVITWDFAGLDVISQMGKAAEH